MYLDFVFHGSGFRVSSDCGQMVDPFVTGKFTVMCRLPHEEKT